MSTNRHQNKSCDCCWRSKKRCTLPASEENSTAKLCSNCLHLGLKCTFDLVKSRSSQRKRLRTPVSTDCESLVAQSRTLCYSNISDASNSASSDQQEWNEQMTEPLWMLDSPGSEYLDPSLLSFYLGVEPAGFGAESFNLSAKAMCYTASTTDKEVNNTAPSPSEEFHTVENDINARRRSFVGILPSSPVHLLNSSMAVNTLSEQLQHIYQTVIEESASRYLEYSSTFFGGRRFYYFEDNDMDLCADSDFNLLGNSIDSQTKSLPLPPIPGQQFGDREAVISQRTITPCRKVTILGIARFLDSFSSLYGSALDPFSDKMCETVVEEAALAFSSQWLSNSDSSGRRIFLDSWFKIRSRLLEVQNTRSFRVIYATFLFDMTVIPPEACLKLKVDGEDHEFLDRSLIHLETLVELVKCHCKVLGPTSVYARLLESSVNIFRWFGFVRDTVASFTTSRQLFFQDFLDGTSAMILGRHASRSMLTDMAENSADNHPTTNGSLSELPVHNPNHSLLQICQNLNGEMILVWRCIITLRSEHIHNHGNYTPLHSENIKKAIEMVDNYEERFNPVRKEIAKSFPQLSKRSRSCVALIVLFSGLGLLSFAEFLRKIVGEHVDLDNTAMGKRIQAYQSIGSSGIAVMVDHVQALPPDDASNGMPPNISITSRHVNFNLIISTLVKAIESLLHYQLSPVYLLKARPEKAASPHSGQPWVHHIQSLMACLLSLDKTVSGSHVVGKALNYLLRQHGDIISECWSPGTIPQPVHH